MKSIINGLIIVISMYVKIPVPKVERSRANMKYAVCFLPCIGCITGALLWAWHRICDEFGFGQQCFALAGVVIAQFVTSGMHLIGFMGTVRAMHVPGKKERSGDSSAAFERNAAAVIAVVCYFMLYAAGLILIWKRNQILLLWLSYIISGALSGMSLVWFPMADRDGMAHAFAVNAHKTTARVVLVTVLALSFISAVLVQPVLGAIMSLTAMWVWTYCYYMSRRRFGGVTDEVAGYLVCLCELACILVIGMIGR